MSVICDTYPHKTELSGRPFLHLSNLRFVLITNITITQNLCLNLNLNLKNKVQGEGEEGPSEGKMGRGGEMIHGDGDGDGGCWQLAACCVCGASKTKN